MTPAAGSLPRRDFLRLGLGAGGALLVTVTLPGCEGLVGEVGRGEGMASPELYPFGAFVRVDGDGAVTVRIPVPEIGQGVRTSLAMLVAEELRVPWSSVSVIQADAADDLGPHPLAGGSHSVRAYWLPLREAGAAARTVLVAAAAERMEVSPAGCTATDGVVRHPSGGSVGYGEVVEFAAAMPLPDVVDLRDPESFEIVGSPVRQIDARDVATGRIPFGSDVRVPGMLRAAVARPPVHGGRVVDWDDTAALDIPGVRRTVRTAAVGDPDRPYSGEGVAVVADDTWSALRGREALSVRWDPGPNADESSERLDGVARDLLSRPGRTFRESGDVDARLARAARRVEARYTVPLIAHAPMEPMNCVVHVTDGGCEVWAPVQVPLPTRRNVAALLELPEEAVVVHTLRSGGGFGRRLGFDFVLEAVSVAREVGVPVQVVWSREDDVRHGFFRPLSHHRLVAGVEEDGRISAWLHHQAATSRYAFREGEDPARSAFRAGTYPGALLPAHRLEFGLIESNVPRGPLRAPGFNAFVFAVESFLDEAFRSAGRDPVEGRLEMLRERDPLPYDEDDAFFEPARLARVIERAAEAADWGRTLPEGVGRGVAVTFTFGSYAAQVAEVEVDRARGDFRVRRIVAALDCGRVVNPLGAAAQVEGGVLDGLGAALYQEITLREGRVEQSNFHDFPLLRMDRAPQVVPILVESGEDPTGAGEPPYPPVGAAVANAIHDAVGLRVRDLPLRLERAEEVAGVE